MVDRTLRDFADLGLDEIIPSTMGEPFLYPDFAKLLRLCAELGICINVTTNGSFPGGGIDYWALLLAPVLSDIKFSVPTLPTQQQRANIQAYQYHKGEDSTTTLQMIVMESTLPSLEEWLQWAMDHGIDRVKFQFLRVHFEALQSESVLRSPESLARWHHKRERLEFLSQNKPIRLQFETEPAPDGITKNGVCPFLGKEAWILEDGEFQVCPHPLAWQGELGSFGNIQTTRLLELWQGKYLQEFIHNWDSYTPPLCRNCDFRVQS